MKHCIKRRPQPAAKLRWRNARAIACYWSENRDASLFSTRACATTWREVCATLDIESTIVLAEAGRRRKPFSGVVSEAMQATDITIFFSRLGDQIRFLDSPGTSKKIMCYTLDRAHLASAFACTDYHADATHARSSAREDHKIEDLYDRGTERHLAGRRGANEIDSGQQAVTDFSLQLFPVMIFPPLHFHPT